MSDTPDLPDQMPFVRWLHAQVKGDQARAMPYAALYRWGKVIHATLGPDGPYEGERLAVELAQQGATADDLAALALAEASWRVDTIIESAEIAGVSLNVGEIDVVPAEMSKEIEAADAVVLCGYRNHRGEGCIKNAVPGSGRCGSHGGAITDPEVRRSFLLIAFAKVIDGSRVAVEALLDVAENGRSEMARVQAAKEILDRAGVQQDQHVHIHRPEEDRSVDDIMDDMRRRLGTTNNRLRITVTPIEAGDDEDRLALMAPREDEDIIDAEVVSEGV